MITLSPRWQTSLAAIAAACALLGCGGSDTAQTSSAAQNGIAQAGNTASTPLVAPQGPGEPALLGNVATDGMNWINYRRTQIGIPVLSHNGTIDLAAQRHSDYQKTNDVVTHEQTAGKPGFTGVSLLDRLESAGYTFNSDANYAYGEVISATSNSSGFYMAEELITAIYHRFVIFEPMFKEIGTGSAATTNGYTYFTSDFASNNGYGPGLGIGQVVNWPFTGQTKVPTNFFSDYEAPDPVAGVNEVGYPVSVHADISAVLKVQSFTIRPHGGANLAVKLLKAGADADTPASAAAIIPMSVLKSGTTYDVTFTGTADAVPVSKSWSFTTK